MKKETMEIMHECTKRSSLGSIRFPEAVKRLAMAGVELYHADLMRSEKTYYLPDGDSHIEPMTLPAPIDASKEFSAEEVTKAIKAIQREEILYPEFLKRIISAGCAFYFVSILGRRAVYFGRSGDNHIEYFPN